VAQILPAVSTRSHPTESSCRQGELTWPSERWDSLRKPRRPAEASRGYKQLLAGHDDGLPADLDAVISCAALARA
jgi:hypothetical protein